MRNIIFFILSYFFFIWQKAIFPTLSLNAFAPYLAYLILTKERKYILWNCLLCGICHDLFSSSKMGLWPAALCLSAFLLYPLRVHFYKDKPLHIAILTAMFSFLNCLFISLPFIKNFTHSKQWFFTDCILMSIFDGIYAIVIFYFPLWAFEKTKFKLFKIKWKR